MSLAPAPIRRRLPVVFYGWWIVVAGFALQGLVGGLWAQAFGAYFVHLQRDFGWSRTVLSGAFSMAQMESGFLGPAQGWLVQRLGPRAIARAGVVVFGIGLMALSRIDSVLTFYAAVLLVAVGSGLSGFLTVNVAIANWFERRRATAMGLASTGWGAGGMMIALVAWSLNTFGWRATAVYSGLLVILIGLPISQLMRHAPEAYGYAPDGRPREPALSEQNGGAGNGVTGFTTRQALRSPAFWLLNAGHAAALLVVSAVMVHLIAYLVERQGMSVTAAALVMTVVTTLSIVGQVAGGFIGDRLDKRLIAAACMVGHCVALLALVVATSLPLILFFAVVHGLSWGMRGPLMAAIRADYFGRASFATIFGFASMVVTLGMIAGPIFAGFLADQLDGDYRIGFTVLALIAGGSSLFFLLARKPALPQPMESRSSPVTTP